MKTQLTLLIVLAGLFAFCNTIEAQTTKFSGKTVIIRNAHDNRALCTLHNSNDPNNKGNQEPLIVYDYYGDATQKWKIVPIGGNFYAIKNVHGERALCTLHNSNDPARKGDGEPIIQYNYYGDHTQHWEIRSVGGGFYNITCAREGRALCTQHNSTSGGHKGNQERIIQHRYNGDATHKWKIEIINESNSGTPSGTDGQTIGERPLPILADGKKAYIISSKTNNWVMDISGGAANVGANIITYPKNKPSGTANQKFRLVPAGGDYVYIESIIGERMVIDVSDYKRHDGANVALVRRGGGTNAQKWKISTYRDGSSEVVSAMGGNYYLGVSDDNRNIVLRVGKKGDKTRFNFKELFENYPANNTTVIKSKSDLDVAGEWIEKNGLVAVNWTGQAGIDAVNWTTTAAKDIANGFDVLFNGEKVPPPRRGATKSNVPSGVRHYVITVFHVGNYSSGGDGSDFEIFGSVSAIPSGHMYTNKGSNPYLFNKRAGDYVVLKTGKHHSVTHRKDFYVRESDAANAYVSIVTALAEHDDFDNDSFSKTDKLNLANLPVGHYKEHEFLVRTYDGENEIVRLYIAVSRVK